MMNKLIGNVVRISDKNSQYYGEWGIITFFEDEYFYIALWCDTLEMAKNFLQ